ncbi:MAG: flippase-like domain-containing protein, partial [Bacilli bacterium]|nr:flippase-like domain-containing protein [Bacilli bacterium]
GWQPPMWPLILIGFLLNLSVILILYLMSFSHKIHNFILHYIIGFLGKIRILKNPDKTRENLRVQVENFKIELRRLQSNIPVLIVQFLLFFGMIFLQYSLPYFCGLALHAFENSEGVQQFVFASTTQASMVSASFRAALHQMVTGLIPLPGSAGVSEMFYEGLFLPFFGNSGSMTTATQILWRTATFHIVLLVSGLVSAFYRSRARESFAHANHETYVNLQFATFEERKRSADTMYETAQLSRIELQKKLRGAGLFKKKEDVSTIGEPVSNLNLPEEKDEMAETRNKLRETREAKRAEEVKAEEPKKKRWEKKKKSKKDKDEGWESWEI